MGKSGITDMAEDSQRSGCLGLFLKLVGIAPGSQAGGSVSSSGVDLPYLLRNDFRSPAELNFYRVLEQAVGADYSINNKVRLWDVLTVPRSDDSRKYENKISSKHIDFLLCDISTMQPMLAIELDDASHKRKDRQERDAFVDGAFAAAGLPILHIQAAGSYSVAEVQQQIAAKLPITQSTAPVPPPLPAGQPPPVVTDPTCPKCHTPMIQRKAAKGKHAGKRFWACTNYPQCREIIGID